MRSKTMIRCAALGTQVILSVCGVVTIFAALYGSPSIPRRRLVGERCVMWHGGEDEILPRGDELTVLPKNGCKVCNNTGFKIPGDYDRVSYEDLKKGDHVKYYCTVRQEWIEGKVDAKDADYVKIRSKNADTGLIFNLVDPEYVKKTIAFVVKETYWSSEYELKD